MKKSALGRGLDALLPDFDAPEGGITQIDITELDRNPDQPRRDFDEEALAALAESIKTSGILQPLLVKEKNGRYQIVAGERRFRAARLAGLTRVPCIVRELSEEEQLAAALIENIQREDLNAIEEAAAIRQLMTQCGFTQEQVSQRVGKSRPAVANLLRLLNLPEKVQQDVRSGQLSAGHARVLAGLESEGRQLLLADRVIREGLSVRELERIVSEPVQMPKPLHENRPKPLPLELQDMETRMRETFGIRTTIKGSRERGKITLQYYSEDELQRLYQCLETLENGN